MIASILWLQSALNFLLKRILIRQGYLIFDLFKPFKGTIVNSYCILISRHDNVISFISIFFNKITLIASIKAYAFFFIKTNSLCESNNFKPSWFTWTLLTAYSKAKLKSNGDKTSPYFKTFLAGNMSDKCLPTCTLL